MKTSIIRAALFTPASNGRWGLPILAWSRPGEAKSAVLRETCQMYGLPCVVLSPGEMGEGAFGVVPIPDKSGVIKYPPPEWTLDVKDGGVVFVDELTCTPPALEPALLGLVLDARIGGTVLHPRVRRIAAANPPEYAANGRDLNPAQANRMGHVDWATPTVAEHSAYMMRGSTGHTGNGHAEFSATAEEERVLSAWGAGAWARAVGLETAFLQARPDLKNKCPKALDPDASRAWPSDRSWENATRALASAQVHGLSEADTDDFVAAFIGQGTYVEWKKWIKDQDLPNAADLLDGKINFQHSAGRLDRTYAILAACTALVTPAQAPSRNDRACAMWGMLVSLMKSGISHDLIITPAQQLIEAKLSANAADPKVRAAYSVLGQDKKFIEVLKMMGMGR